MKGDFSRDTFDRSKHYSSVRRQQGRVDVDADWNEQVDIELYRRHITSGDVIGPSGGPAGVDAEGKALAGFEITEAGADLGISAGRYYVDGILVENEEATTLRTQPDLAEASGADNADYFDPDTADNGTYVAYLHVWERHETFLDDPAIREVALGGPDTASRTRVVWQVRLQGVASGEDLLDCSNLVLGWTPDAWDRKPGTLAARAEPDPAAEGPCVVPAGAGYRGLENQLYRVEVHDAGNEDGASFKWSRENGSIVTRCDTWNDAAKTMIVSPPPHPAPLGFAAGDWVELIDEAAELRGEPGTLVQLDDAEGDRLVLPPAFAADPTGFKVRRWEVAQGNANATFGKSDGAAGGWIELEDGVQVKVGTGDYRTGDYWLIPARTATGDVEWPLESDGTTPSLRPPRGIIHHFAPLALVTWNGAGFSDHVEDLRRLFRPLTALMHTTCCTVTVGNGVTSCGDFSDLNAALESVRHWQTHHGGAPATVCLLSGIHTLTATVELNGDHDLTIHGCGPGTRVMGPGSNKYAFLVTGCTDVRIESFALDLTEGGNGVNALNNTRFSLCHVGVMHVKSGRIGVQVEGAALLQGIAVTADAAMTAGFRVKNADGVVLSDCAVKGAGSAGGVQIQNGSDVHISRLAVDSNGRTSAIMIKSTQAVTVDGFRIENLGAGSGTAVGIEVEEAAGVRVRNGAIAATGNMLGILLRKVTDAEVAHCRFSGTAAAQGKTFVVEQGGGIVIHGCQIEGGAEVAGIRLQGCRDTEVAHSGLTLDNASEYGVAVVADGATRAEAIRLASLAVAGAKQAVLLDGCTDVALSDCSVSGGPKEGGGLLIDDASDVRVADCTVNCAQAGGAVRLTAKAFDVAMVGSVLRGAVDGDSGTPALAVAGARDVAVRGGILSGVPAATLQGRDIVLSGNDVTGGGLRIVEGSEAVTVDGNRIGPGSGPGIMLGGAALDADAAAKAPGLMGMDLRDNRIAGMTGTGIRTNPEFAKKLEWGEVEGLTLAENRISECAIAPNGEDRVGGVVLEGSVDLTVSGNVIRNNRRKDGGPVCGIFVDGCENLAVSGNRVTDNGAEKGKMPDSAGWQAGIAALNLVGDGEGGAAAVIHGNTVSCPLGQALLVSGGGGMIVADNDLRGGARALTQEELSDGTLTLFQAGQCALILNVNSGLFHAVVLVDTPQSNYRWGGQPKDIRAISEEAVLFHGNRLSQTVARGDVLGMAAVVIGTGDVAVADNLFECTEVAGNAVDLITLGASQRVRGNRLVEPPNSLWLSAMTYGLLGNITADNQADHCVLALGGNVVNRDNQMFINDCSVIGKVIGVPGGGEI